MNSLLDLFEAQPLPFTALTGKGKESVDVEWVFSTDSQTFSLRAYVLNRGKGNVYKRNKGATVFSLFGADGQGDDIKLKRKIDRLTKPLNVISTIAEVISTEMIANKMSDVSIIRIPNKMNVETATRIMARYIKLKAPLFEVLGAVDGPENSVYIVACRKGKDPQMADVFGEGNISMREFVEAKDDEEVQAALKKTNAIIRRLMLKDNVAAVDDVASTTEDPSLPDGVDPSDVPVAPAVTWDTYDHKAGAILNFKEAVTKTIAEGTMGSIADMLSATPTVLRDNIDWENTTKFPLDIPGGHAGEALYADDLRRATQIIGSHMMNLANNNFFNSNNIEYIEKLQHDNWIVTACLDWFKELPQMSSKPAFTVNSYTGISNLWGLLVRGVYRDFLFGTDLIEEFKNGYSSEYDSDALRDVNRGLYTKLRDCSGPLRLPWLLDAEKFVADIIVETMSNVYKVAVMHASTYKFDAQIKLMTKVKGTKWYHEVLGEYADQVNKAEDIHSLRHHSNLVNAILSLPEFHASLPVYVKILNSILAIQDDEEFKVAYKSLNPLLWIINILINRGYKDIEAVWIKLMDRAITIDAASTEVAYYASSLYNQNTSRGDDIKAIAMKMIEHARATDAFSSLTTYDHSKQNTLRLIVKFTLSAHENMREAYKFLKNLAPELVSDNIYVKNWLLQATREYGSDTKLRGDSLIEVVEILKEEGWYDASSMNMVGMAVRAGDKDLTFEGESAAKILQINNEIHDMLGESSAIFNEKYWYEGKSADERKHRLNDIAEIVYEANKFDSGAVDDFFAKSESKIKKTITDNMMVNELIGGPLFEAMQEHSELKPYGKMDVKRAIQMAGFNSLNVKDIATLTGVKFGKNTVPSEYIKQIMDKFADGTVTVPKPMVDKVNLTNAEVKEAHERFLSMHAGKHGDIYPRIINVFNAEVGNRKAFDKFFEDRSAEGFNEKVLPAVHGCGGIAANMILRYGYIVIPAGAEGTTGRMLGNGIYFTNKIDKAMLYVSNEGYGKTIGSRGYIFELDTNLGAYGKDHLSAGVSGRDGIRSPEWCVKYPEKQTYIYKVYEVELVTRKMIERTQRLLSESEPSEFVDFSKYLMTEAADTPDNLLEVTFYSDDVPVIRGGELKVIPANHVKPKRIDNIFAGAGIELVDGYTTLRFPARQTDYWTFAQPKHLRDKDLDTYAKLFDEYFDVVGYDD